MVAAANRVVLHARTEAAASTAAAQRPLVDAGPPSCGTWCAGPPGAGRPNTDGSLKPGMAPPTEMSRAESHRSQVRFCRLQRGQEMVRERRYRTGAAGGPIPAASHWHIAD